MDTQGGLLRLGAIVLAAGAVLAAFAYWYAPLTELVVLVFGLGGVVVLLLNTIDVSDGEQRR